MVAAHPLPGIDLHPLGCVVRTAPDDRGAVVETQRHLPLPYALRMRE